MGYHSAVVLLKDPDLGYDLWAGDSNLDSFKPAVGESHSKKSLPNPIPQRWRGLVDAVLCIASLLYLDNRVTFAVHIDTIATASEIVASSWRCDQPTKIL